ncbi:hypothetical protein RhiTH_001434 [Rhizoctonia solani]
MFGILAVGVQLNTDLPPYHQDAEQYHMLARAALALDCSSENTTVSAIQSILLMCYFCQLTDNKDSPMHHWALIGLGMKLAVGIGLHRDGKRWDLDPAEAELRRALWWEAFSATAPSYEKVLKLHKRLREFEGPPHLHVPGFFGNKYKETSLYVDNSLQLERHTTFCVPETILMHLHRSFFARAISESPDDPLQSRYAESVIAIHEAVLRHLAAVRSLFSLLPNLAMRFWLYWSHAFSGATILAALVIRCPGSSLSISALKGLDEVSDLFSQAQNACRARRALPTILKLRQRAHYAFKEYHSGHPTIISLDGSPPGNSDSGREENTLLGGRTRVITYQGQASEYRSGQSTSSTLSPYSDESGSVASGVAVGDSLNDHHSLDPYLNTYAQGVNMQPGSLSTHHHIDPTNSGFDPGCDAPLVALHPGMLGPQSPTSYYSYPPTGNYPYPGQQQPLPFSHDPDRQPPTPNNVDYTWQALMASIGVQGRQA